MTVVNNPILKGFNPDPCMTYANGKWYIAVSTFEWAPGVTIYESEDFVNWNISSNVLDRYSQLNMIGEQPSGGIWAPGLSYADEKFWLVYTDNKIWKGETSTQPIRDMHNYLVTSSDTKGKWSEPIKLLSNIYDPYMFHDNDGTKWLVYTKRDFRRIHDDIILGIYIRKYDHDKEVLVGEEIRIYTGSNIEHNFYIDAQIYEGPYMLQKDGYYYLITAEGGPGVNHSTCISRSRNIEGPYESHPLTPMLTSYGSSSSIKKAGHGNIIEGPNGEWFISYLCARPFGNTERSPLGRETGIDKIVWKDGWPYLENGSINPSDSFEVISNTEQNEDTSWECDFTNIDKLPLEFLTLRDHFTEDWARFTKGGLELTGRESPVSRFRQSLIGARIRNYEFESTVRFEYSPKNFNHMSGIMIRYDEDTFYYLANTANDTGKNVISFLKMEKGQFKYYDSLYEIKGQSVELKISCVANILNFYVKENEEFIKLMVEGDFLKVSDEYATPVGYTGSFIAITSNDLDGEGRKCTFKNWNYIGK